jgi:putative ABC transport system permease protein
VRSPRIDALVQDVRSAVRRLRRAPGLCVLVISSLALGIGASTALFSVARAVIFEAVPYRDDNRMVELSLYLHDAPARITEAQIAAIQEAARSLERIEAYSSQRFDWQRADSTVRLRGRIVTPSLPSAMTMRVLVGRNLAAEDGLPGSDPVVLISEEFWRREFDSAADIIGRPLLLEDIPRTVIGVASRPTPRTDVDVWVPHGLDPNGDWLPSAVAWLRPGISIDAARAELAGIATALPAVRPGLLSIRLSRPGERDGLSSIAQSLLLFWGASAFLLAIACANLANIMLARNLAMVRDVAVRAALGASRFRLARMHLAEALLLALAGGLGGVLLSMWGTAAFLALRPVSLSIVYPSSVPLDLAAVGYTLTLAIIVALAVGLAPAIRAAGIDPLVAVVRGDVHGHGAVPARWLFGGAVAAQAGLATVLLLGAGLMATNYVGLLRTDPGLDPDNVLHLSVQLDSPAYLHEATRREFFGRVAERVGRLDGVTEVAVATDVPRHGYYLSGAIEIDSRPAEPIPGVDAAWVHVTPSYFSVMRIPYLEGRPLTESDGEHGGVAVSQSFARKYWPERTAVGQRFRHSRADGSGTWFHIVGVVGDVMSRGLRMPEDDADEVYLPYSTSRVRGSAIVARTHTDRPDLLQAMQAQVWAVDSRVPIGRLGTMRQSLVRSIDEQPFYTSLLGASSVIGLVLAGVGVFGVVAYAASRRRREIAVRIALGAQAANVERLVVLQGLVPALAGILAGLAAGSALTRFMRSMVHGVNVTEPSVYVAAALILVGVSLVAAWLPARRASRVDPMLALRSE